MEPDLGKGTYFPLWKTGVKLNEVLDMQPQYTFSSLREELQRLDERGSIDVDATM